MAGIAISGYAALTDARIYYEVYGAGPPLILLHGNGEDLHIFDSMIPALAEKHRVIALDTRGHGRSGRGSLPLRFETFAQDIVGVMDRLQLPGACLIGYSDGGNTALHVALAHPSRTTGLVLLGANLSPEGMFPKYRIPITAAYHASRATASFSEKGRRKRELLALMACQPRLTPGMLCAINVPALVLAGQRDVIRPAHTAAIANAIPLAEKTVIANEDHYSLVASRSATQRILFFLGRHNL